MCIFFSFLFRFFFCILRRNLRWPPKIAGKQVLRKSPVDSVDTRGGAHKFLRNISISHHFRGKCILRRNSRWLPKMAGKQFLGKVTSRLCRSPVGQKFCRKRSISHNCQDKYIFAFYPEIQVGHQKVGGKQFLGKVASRLCR